VDKISDVTEVSSTEVAAVLGLSVRRIQQMIQDGTLQTVRKGRLNLADAVRRYITFLSKDMATADAEDLKIDKSKRSAEALLKASKAQIAKLEADELKGKMHRSDDVAAMTEDLIYTIRGALLALPGRVAVDVSVSPAEAAEIIRKEVYKVMRELAGYRYDPEKYEELVRGRMNWENEKDDDD